MDLALVDIVVVHIVELDIVVEHFVLVVHLDLLELNSQQNHKPPQ